VKERVGEGRREKGIGEGRRSLIWGGQAQKNLRR